MRITIINEAFGLSGVKFGSDEQYSSILLNQITIKELCGSSKKVSF